MSSPASTHATAVCDDLASFDARSLLARREITADALVRAHPPRLSNRNKQIVHALASPPGAHHAGTLTVSRWRGLPAPLAIGPTRTEFELHRGAFDYASPAIDAANGHVSWYLNFADRNLFGYYGGPLFAQDEMQVAEHPVLASVREWLLAEMDAALRPETQDRDHPTPILIRGAERRCAIVSNQDAAAGRPNGLYGNQFSHAAESAIRNATTVLQPPSVSNVIAIEAPRHGDGAYQRAQVEHVLMTAYTGFRAAQRESQLALGAPARTIVHTGGWGTGAYGGNKLLMALVQLIAARAAGIAELVYHAFDASSERAWNEAVAHFARDLEPRGDTAAMLGAVVDMGLKWGTSDGN